MPVIAHASIKGGVGKTTSLLAVAAELALDGKRVIILDADPNGHAARIGTKIVRRVGSHLEARGGITEANILAEIRRAKADAEFVFVDLPGVSSKLTLLGLTKADLVVIPCQASDMDVHDALETAGNVRQAEDAADRNIPAVFLLTRWPVTVETRVGRKVAEKLAAKAPNVQVLPTPLMERVHFKEMSFNGVVPRQAEPGGNAAANVTALAAQLLAALGLNEKEMIG